MLSTVIHTFRIYFDYGKLYSILADWEFESLFRKPVSAVCPEQTIAGPQTSPTPTANFALGAPSKKRCICIKNRTKGGEGALKQPPPLTFVGVLPSERTSTGGTLMYVDTTSCSNKRLPLPHRIWCDAQYNNDRWFQLLLVFAYIYP